VKIICIGRNYPQHAAELGNEKPESPVIFIKPETAKLQRRFPFYIPHFSNEIHHEVEVLVKINRIGKYIEEKFANKYYQEIGLGIDFTARDLQQNLKEKGLPWEKAKAFDGSALIGSWYEKENFTDLNQLDFELVKNGSTVQEGNTSQMLWSIDALIAEVSRFFTLKIGDVIFTGTPAGVGPVVVNDVLEGYLGEEKAFKINIK
jgi:2-keto-4-pentenoate hydratase/2-oxohepta-3-ene-1,7-dioic acid hydratase in catechol pathway|tara:strand:+ start:683 stop:1294 length:612 start_codon:yes stop_codon:yes gene_type:complete